MKVCTLRLTAAACTLVLNHVMSLLPVAFRRLGAIVSSQSARIPPCLDECPRRATVCSL